MAKGEEPCFFFPSDSVATESGSGVATDVVPEVPESTAPPVSLASPQAEPNHALWLWYLYFRPKQFFTQFVIEPMPFLTVLCAWTYGMAGVIDRLAVQHTRGSALTATMNWGVYLGFVTGLGVFGGLAHYLIGGWWYRVRLGWSGVNGAEPALARRVYLYASQVVAIPAVLIALGQATVYASPAEMMDADTPAALGLSVAVLFFMLWSVWTSYSGVTTVFKTIGLGRARLWFLLLPGMLFLTVFALIFTAGVFVAMAQVTEPPDLDNPQAYRGSLVRFGYPGNWRIEPARPRAAGTFSIRVLAAQDAMLAVEIYHSQALPEEELALVVTGLRGRFGQWRDEFLASRWGRMKGVGVKAIADIDGDPYRFTVLIVPLSDKRCMEIRQVVLLEHELDAAPGFALIEQSFKLSRRLFE